MVGPATGETRRESPVYEPRGSVGQSRASVPSIGHDATPLVTLPYARNNLATV
jgi:hypothetical protein